MIFTFMMCGGLLFAQQKDKAVEYVNEGVLYHDEGQYDRALAMYDKALKD
ncbi:MAG: tetratricopeptide repeat protein [Acidobacteria bacterium]|nr:tetratricopeptide repeat protein [Acidobacteriota bacterium]